MKQIVNPFVYDAVEELKQVAPTITSWLHPTFSQKYEDVIVMALLDAYALKVPEPLKFGYVEIGANHPIATSSTYLMRQTYKCNGILVEANPELAANLRKFRPNDHIIAAACVPQQGVDEIEMVICNDANELSSSDPEFVKRFMAKGLSYSRKKVPAIYINEVMHIANNAFSLFYLSVDVEGPDADILAAINYEAYRPVIIQVEASEAIKPGNSARIRAIMERAGYVLIAHTFINFIFIDGERL